MMGFNAWGISNGTAAGLMITEGIRTGTRPWDGSRARTRHTR
jgi:glycine/D-amino acid oxidase-like deaminating enzyme